MGLTFPGFKAPPVIDWTRVRTWWICPTFDGVKLDESKPIAVRAQAESLLYAQFKTQADSCFEMGADHVWIGEPAKDGVDWLDPREWYAIHAQFSGEMPPQVKRPYRLSPLTTYDGQVDAATIFDRSLEALAAGDIDEGFDLYEFRWGTLQGSQQRVLMEMPYWDGKIVDGLKLIIHAEQGAGDTMQFARFLNEIPDNIEADLLLPRESIRLFTQSFPKFKGAINYGMVKEYDAHIPICSLPLALKLDYRKEYKPYLRSHWYKRLEFASRMNQRSPRGVQRPVLLGRGLNASPEIDYSQMRADRVGIVWSGSPTHLQNAGRCLKLEDVIAACPPGSCLYSLQKGAGAEQLKYLPDDVTVIDWTDELKDWADTAALVDDLDLIVSIDSGIVHLAGALGKPVKLLVPGPLEWRWKAGIRWYEHLQIVTADGSPLVPYESPTCSSRAHSSHRC